MTDPKPFARLRELLDRATPGDWDNRCRGFSNTEWARHIWSNYGWIATFERPLDSAEADAELICELRNNAEKLLEALDEAERALEYYGNRMDSGRTAREALATIRALGGI